MKMKLLSPAGDFESLKMAVYYGADEVYLGVKNFNARNIEGFNLDTLKQSVDFAHIFGTSVHLAINILFDDNELQDALDLIVDAYNIGVDAFIIQDLGLAYLVHKHYPQITMHASTQMGIHNLEGAKFAKNIGFSRIVLARETPLDEIKRIKDNLDIEIEYFAQGALCVCFSGNCYLSSYIFGASGNRGKCKQPCRLPYTLKNGNKKLADGYLLSAKDFNMSNRLKDLEDAGVCSIKIEGRARRPFYVATATKEYRKLLDGEKCNQQNLELAYNRNYTAGYFDGNSNIISKHPAHIGINVGEITDIKNGKKFNQIYFTSNKKLNPKSTFKIFRKQQEISTLCAYDLKECKNGYVLTTTQTAKIGDKINLIIDNDLEQQILSFSKKVKVDIKVEALPQQQICAHVNLQNLSFSVFGEICQTAKNCELTKDEIISNFKKSEYFDANVSVNTKNVFVQKQKLNEFRRQVFNEIFEKLTKNYEKNAKKLKINENYSIIKLNNFEFTNNNSNKYLQKNIIYSPEFYQLDDVKTFIENCKKQNKNPYLDLPNFALEKDVEVLKHIIEKTKISIVANNYYALNFNTSTIAGGGLNVYNSISAQVLNLPIITAESDFNKYNFSYMTLRHCPLKQNLNASCDKCPYNQNYTLVMQNGKVLKLSRKKMSTCTFYLS